MKGPFVIAVDGPAASGKGTIAKRLGETYELPVLDTGLLYRAVGEASSRVAAIPDVRTAILDFQRQFGAHPPGGARGAVIDGRDIGTVICPDATAKLFVDARPDVRAYRRWLELKAQNAGPLPDIGTIEAELIARDARDRSRPVAPLHQAADAVLLDTSDLDIEAAFAKALELVNPSVEKALAACPRG
jgi:cytidylate kinase